MAQPEIITVSDLRRLGYCVAGQKRWFQANGMDFTDFLKNGISTDEFLEQGDGLARKAVDRLIAENEDG